MNVNANIKLFGNIKIIEAPVTELPGQISNIDSPKSFNSFAPNAASQ